MKPALRLFICDIVKALHKPCLDILKLWRWFLVSAVALLKVEGERLFDLYTAVVFIVINIIEKSVSRLLLHNLLLFLRIIWLNQATR
jgi:hypothetical protein